MSRIIGDRREKSVLDEMEEVARERNKDVAEEDRLEALRKAKEAISKKAPLDSAASEKAEKTFPAIYEWMEIEPKVLRILSQPAQKIVETYGKSLWNLRQRGYLRHCFPADAFAFICDGLEGKLNAASKAIFEDMAHEGSEWLSMAWRRKGNSLIAYLHPEGFAMFAMNGSKPKERNTITYSSKNEFDITGKQSGSWIPLKEMGDEFNEFIFSRKYADLPTDLQEGGRYEASVSLPPDDLDIYPIAYGLLSGICIITYEEVLSASRGIRPRGKQ